MYNLSMKITCLGFVFCLVIAALVGGFMGELAYAHNSQGCSCCTTNKCHANTKCHNTTKACVCKHQAIQAFLPQGRVLTGFVFTGYLAQKARLTYIYLSSEDIFHPPRV